MYSDSKNWFTFGNFFLTMPIVAQGTKPNLWEFLTTKESIMTLFVPNIRISLPFIDLIWHLQFSHSMNQFLCW